MNRRESLARNLPDDLPESGPRPVPLEEQTDILRPIEERPPGPVETGERKIPASKWKKFDAKNPMIVTVSAKELDGLLQTASFKHIGSYEGAIGEGRDDRALMVLERVKPEGGLPNHYIYDDGNAGGGSGEFLETGSLRVSSPRIESVTLEEPIDPNKPILELVP